MSAGRSTFGVSGRKVSCVGCRQKRLKCVRTSPRATCQRCLTSERKCVLPERKFRFHPVQKNFGRRQKWVKTPPLLIFIDESDQDSVPEAIHDSNYNKNSVEENLQPDLESSPSTEPESEIITKPPLESDIAGNKKPDSVQETAALDVVAPNSGSLQTRPGEHREVAIIDDYTSNPFYTYNLPFQSHSIWPPHVFYASFQALPEQGCMSLPTGVYCSQYGMEWSISGSDDHRLPLGVPEENDIRAAHCAGRWELDQP
ncbi:hypothetical protein V8F20_002803 [Naviculisporaceae sp. PSN 640]